MSKAGERNGRSSSGKGRALAERDVSCLDCLQIGRAPGRRVKTTRHVKERRNRRQLRDEDQMTSLQGKTLFITGASRGIGKAIALRAARDGANIVVAAKTSEPDPRLPGTIHTAATEIEAAGGKAMPVVVDVRSDEQVRGAVEAAAARFGSIDILVNNASAIHLAGVAQTPMKRFDLMMDINVRGAYLCAQACLPHLLASANPSHPDAVPADRRQSQMVPGARGLYDVQIRDEHGEPRPGGRAAKSRRRLKLAVAAHHHRDQRAQTSSVPPSRSSPERLTSWPMRPGTY